MLIVLTSHPIQYQVPLWQELARDGGIQFEVWYLTAHAVHKSHDPGFAAEFAWDMDLLAGYPYRFLEVAEDAKPGSFWKCRLTEGLRHRLRASGARVLWIQGWQVAAYWQAVWEAKSAGVEVWLRGESNDLAPVSWWKSDVKKLLLGWLFHRVSRFLYIGTANRRLYEKFGVQREQLYPAPYGVDNQRFARQAEAIRSQRPEIRSQWQIPVNAFCVLFCGKFISKKRPLDLVKAAQLLITSNRLSNVHLLFVGSGQLGPALRARCQVAFDAESQNLTSDFRPSTSEMEPTASFVGFLNQTEISRAYVAADCLVLPSDTGETWGLVVNEAMACGVPCVVSDACGCAEDMVVPLDPMLRYPCGDVERLADALQRAARNPPSPAAIQDRVNDHDMRWTVKTVERLLTNRLEASSR